MKKLSLAKQTTRSRPPAKPGEQAAPGPPAETMAKSMAQTAARDDARSSAPSAPEASANATTKEEREMGELQDAALAESMPMRASAPQPSVTAPAQAHDAKKAAEVSKRKAAAGGSGGTVYEELDSFSMTDEAAGAVSREEPPAAPAYKTYNPNTDKDAPSGSKAEASATQELPGFSLRLDPGKQSAEVLAGLKAMGAELVSGPERAKNGEPAGDGYVLRVPAAMIQDLAPYLARYGKAERAGVLSAGQLPVRILLRILPAPK